MNFLVHIAVAVRYALLGVIIVGALTVLPSLIERLVSP
jgi:hypothetical protein